MNLVRKGDTIADIVSIYDGGVLTDPDTSTEELVVTQIGNGTPLTITGVTFTKVEDGVFQVEMLTTDSDLVEGGTFVAHMACDVGGVRKAIPLPHFSMFRIEDFTVTIAETLEARHGQGLWGPSYARSTVDAELMFPIGSLSSSTDFARYSFDDEDALDPWEVSAGSPTFIEGPLGPADGAVLLTDMGGDELFIDSTAVHDLTEVDDFFLACAFIAGNGLPSFQKFGGSTGWIVGPDGSNGLRFVVDGATTTTSTVASCDTYGEKGAVIVAAVSRTSGKMRVGIMSRDGTYAESTLDTAPLTTSATANELRLTTDDACAVSDAMIAVGGGLDITGVPENLEDIVRAYHARVFAGGDVDLTPVTDQLDDVEAAIAIIDNFVDDLETRLTSTRAGYLDKLNITGNVASQASVDVVDGLLDALTLAVADLPADGAEAVWDETMEGSATYGDGMRAILSGIFGKVTNFLTGVLVFKGAIDTAKTRQTVVTDSGGRQTSTQGDWT